jgi:hypothetical protein
MRKTSGALQDPVMVHALRRTLRSPDSLDVLKQYYTYKL